MNDGKVAGSLLLISGIICLVGIIIAEALVPGYSTSANYISDLGIGPSSFVFNSAVFVLGILVLVSAYFVQRAFTFSLFTTLLAMGGIGGIGVGLFTEAAGIIHGIFSAIIFVFGGLSAIASYRLQKPPSSYFSVILGAGSLLALGFYALGIYLGLGVGGMERMIAYPELIWAISFGSYLLNDSKKTPA